MRRHAVLIAFLLALLAAPAPAMALVTPAEVAREDVVVEPGAAVTAAQEGSLRTAAARLRAEGVPTKFVILAERPVNIVRYAVDLRAELGFTGNLLALAPADRALGIATPLGSRRANEAFEAERPRLRADPVDGTIAVAERLARAPSGAAGSERGGSPWSLLVVFGLIGAGVAAFGLSARRRARRQAERALLEQREALEPLVDALAAKVTALDEDMQLAGERAERARADADEATLAYGEAREAIPAAATAEALAAARATLERGLRAAQRAEAVLQGRPVPKEAEEPLLGGLCAFDPSHGRAVTTARITTPSGDEAEVPVCRRDADALAEGLQPGVRTVHLGGRPVPYWQGAGLGGFGGSLFPILGGVFGSMLLYDLLTPDVSHAAMPDTDGFGGDVGGLGGGGGFGGFDGGGFGGGGDF